MAYIKKLKDKDNNTIYPQSITSAVMDSEGVSLDAIHSTFVTSESVTEVNPGGITVCESVANKTAEIDANSTDIEYPTAKAVYEYGLAIKSVGIQMTKVDELPAAADAQNGLIYLKPKSPGEENNIYEEFIVVDKDDGNKAFEKIGDTTVDLTSYATKDYVNSVAAGGLKVETLTQEEYDSLAGYDLNTLYVIG